MLGIIANVCDSIPVVLSSGQTWKRKLQMVLLFSLSLIMIGMTATRIVRARLTYRTMMVYLLNLQPKVIEARGLQQYRTVWASAEILAATFVVNAVTLGSFLRDKGAKKNKFKRSYSVSTNTDRASARRATLATLYKFDSDDDDDDAALFHAMGYGVPVHLRSRRSNTPRPAPPAFAASEGLGIGREASEELVLDARESRGSSSDSDDSFEARKLALAPPNIPTTQNLDLFDVGHWLEGREPLSGRSLSRTRTVESGCANVSAQDFAHPTHAESGSRTFLGDIGGIMNTTFVKDLRDSTLSARRHQDSHSGSRPRPGAAPIGVLGPMLERHETQVSLQDAGGLLGSGNRLSTSNPNPRPSMCEAGRVFAAAQSTAGPEAEVDFVDVGGLLDDDRRPDHSAIALQPMRSRHSLEQRANPSPAQRPHGPDDMVLNDPGGLMEP